MSAGSKRVSKRRVTEAKPKSIYKTSSSALPDIRSHPRGRIGRAWRTRQDVRECAAEQGSAKKPRSKSASSKKAKEFVKKGAEVYAKA